MRVRYIALVVSAAVTGIAGCDSATGSEVTFPGLDTQRYDPLPAYRDWWAEINECSGLSADFGRLRFYVVNAPLFEERSLFPCGVEGGDFLCNGFWQKPHFIVLAPIWLEDERLVKHEMLHDLIRTTAHPPVFRSCGVR